MSQTRRIEGRGQSLVENSIEWGNGSGSRLAGEDSTRSATQRMRRYKARATAGSVSAAAGAGADARRGFRGRHRLCVKLRAGNCLNNPEPDLEKYRLWTTVFLSTLVESWSGPRWAGVSENGSEGQGPDRRQQCNSASPTPPIGPQSSGSARRWLSFEGKLHIEPFRITLNGLGWFHMGNPGFTMISYSLHVVAGKLKRAKFEINCFNLHTFTRTLKRLSMAEQKGTTVAV